MVPALVSMIDTMISFKQDFLSKGMSANNADSDQKIFCFASDSERSFFQVMKDELSSSINCSKGRKKSEKSIEQLIAQFAGLSSKTANKKLNSIVCQDNGENENATKLLKACGFAEGEIKKILASGDTGILVKGIVQQGLKCIYDSESKMERTNKNNVLEKQLSVGMIGKEAEPIMMAKTGSIIAGHDSNNDQKTDVLKRQIISNGTPLMEQRISNRKIGTGREINTQVQSDVSNRSFAANNTGSSSPVKDDVYALFSREDHGEKKEMAVEIKNGAREKSSGSLRHSGGNQNPGFSEGNIKGDLSTSTLQTFKSLRGQEGAVNIEGFKQNYFDKASKEKVSEPEIVARENPMEKDKNQTVSGKTVEYRDVQKEANAAERRNEAFNNSSGKEMELSDNFKSETIKSSNTVQNIEVTGRTYEASTSHARTAVNGSGIMNNQTGVIKPQVICDQVIERIQSRIHGSTGRIKLSLTPPQLGSIDMDMRIQDKRVHLVLQVENIEVRQVLQANMEQLKGTLNSQGLVVDDISVLIQEKADSWQDEYAKQEMFFQEGKNNKDSRTRQETDEKAADEGLPVSEINKDEGQNDSRISFFA